MNEPIQYREYTIRPASSFPFWYEHKEYTGVGDKRCGFNNSIIGAKSDIDNMTIEEQEHQIAILRKRIETLEFQLWL